MYLKTMHKYIKSNKQYSSYMFIFLLPISVDRVNAQLLNNNNEIKNLKRAYMNRPSLNNF